MGVKWYHTLVLICTSLIINIMLSTFPCIWSYVFSSDSSVYLAVFIFNFFYLSVFEYPHFPESLHTASPVVLRCSVVFLNHQSLAPGIWGSVITLWFSGMCPGLPLAWDLNELWNEQHWDQPLRWPSNRWPIQSALLSSVWDGAPHWVEPSSPETLGSALERSRDKGEKRHRCCTLWNMLLSCVFIWLLLIFN